MNSKKYFSFAIFMMLSGISVLEAQTLMAGNSIAAKILAVSVEQRIDHLHSLYFRQCPRRFFRQRSGRRQMPKRFQRLQCHPQIQRPRSRRKNASILYRFRNDLR